MVMFNSTTESLFDSSGFVATASAAVEKPKLDEANAEAIAPVLTGDERRKIRSALAALPSAFHDDYGKWIGIGFALWRENPDYFGLFDEFSSQSEKYEGREECQIVWNGMLDKPTKGKHVSSIRSLYYHARQNGWRWATEEVTEDSADERYPSMSLDALLSEDYELDYIIDGWLIANHHCIIGGPPKSFKTTLLLDAAYNLSTGGKFLGEFECRKMRVLVMSGESGAASIQQSLRAMVEAYGGQLPEDGYFQVTEALPKFAKEADIESLRLKLRQLETEVVFIDPAYLAMGGAEASNLQSQGELLRAVGDMCREEGVTLVLAHHVSKEAAKKTSKPLELGDLVWAGFSEWTRQWWMINRRSKYVPGSGKHELRVNIGNSARHSAVWAIDIDEGTASDPSWQTTIVTDEACEVELAGKKRGQRFLEECERVTALLTNREVTDGLSQTAIANRSRLSGAKAKKALESLTASGAVKQVAGKKKGSVVYRIA